MKSRAELSGWFAQPEAMRQRLEHAQQRLATLEADPEQSYLTRGSIVYERGRIKHLKILLEK